MITIMLFLLKNLIPTCHAQVAYDPHFIVGWNSMPQFPSYIMSPYDIVLDHLNTNTLPIRLRSPKFLTGNTCKEVLLTGFCDLRISGSGQFTQDQFLAFVQLLTTKGLAKPKDILVIDLREESHGFINGDAITVYYGPLSFKRHQPASILLHDEAVKLNFIRQMPYIFVYKIIKGEDGMPLNKVPFLYQVKRVASEQEIVQEMGARYVRLPVTDHFPPNNKTVDAFVDLVKTLPPETWLHVKCRGGKGRTTTFMVMYDMLKNPTLPRKKFFKRQVFIQGMDLSQIASVPKKEWKKGLGLKRFLFLNRFHKYLQAEDGYKVCSWSTWVRKHFPAPEDELFQTPLE